jgi:hypothetical protein
MLVATLKQTGSSLQGGFVSVQSQHVLMIRPCPSISQELQEDVALMHRRTHTTQPSDSNPTHTGSVHQPSQPIPVSDSLHLLLQDHHPFVSPNPVETPHDEPELEPRTLVHPSYSFMKSARWEFVTQNLVRSQRQRTHINSTEEDTIIPTTSVREGKLENGGIRGSYLRGEIPTP